MGKRKRAACLHGIEKWKLALCQDETISIIREVTVQDILAQTSVWKGFLELFYEYLPQKRDVARTGSPIDEARAVIRTCLNLLVKDTTQKAALIRSRLLGLSGSIRLANSSRLPSHSEKRALIHSLGISRKPYSVSDILRYHRGPIQIVWRTRTDGAKSRMYVTESPAPEPNCMVASEDTGYYVVRPDISVIFLSGNEDSFEVELVIIRDVVNKSEFSSDLFEWLTAVVDAACRDRRNVRPNHEGHMAQIGLNMGPRNARILGYAKSFTKNLSEAKKVERDEEIIGAASLFWSIIKSSAPSDVSKYVEKYLRDANYPRLATRNVKEDTGFYLQLRDTAYFFPLQERGPPEVYMSKRYVAWTHVDPAHCKYAFSFCVQRTVTQPAVQTGYSPPDPSSRMLSSPFIDGGGANFVDASLKVLVKQAAATMMVFRPNFLHGTTLASGAFNHAITLAFSQRVADAWKEKMMKEGVYLQKEAGEGNPDTL